MTGTVTRIRGTKGNFCSITDTTGKDYFAHRSDFVIPGSMRLGALVEFRVKLAKTGILPAATDVVLIQPIAA